MFSTTTFEAAQDWFAAMKMRGLIPGYLGRPDPGGTYTFAVPGMPGRTFVRIWQGESVTIETCINAVCPNEPSLRVWMERFGGVLRVMYPDPIDAANLFGQNVGAAGVPTHMPANDTSPVNGSRIFDRLVHAPDPAFAGLNVCIEAGLTLWGYRPRDPNESLSGFTPPTSGMRWWVLCYEDDTGVQFSTTGSVETAAPPQNMILDNGGDTSVAALENVTIPSGASPLAGIILDNGQTVIDANTVIVPWRFYFGSEGAASGVTHPITFEASSTLTIASGAVTVTKDFHLIDTQAGAGSDDLDTISGGATGQTLVIRAANTSHTVVVKNGTGNIQLSGGTDYSLDTDTLQLLLVFNGTNWTDVSPPAAASGGAPAGAHYVTTQADATLTNEVIHPELVVYTSGSDIDFRSSPSTGTGVSLVSTTDGLAEISFTANSWQYLSVASVIGTGDFDLRARITMLETTLTPTTVGALFGVAVWDSSHTTSTQLGSVISSGATGQAPFVFKLVGTSTTNFYFAMHRPILMRLVRVGTTVSFYMSTSEGRVWSKFAPDATSSLNVAHVGFAMNGNTNGEGRALVEWLRQ